MSSIQSPNSSRLVLLSPASLDALADALIGALGDSGAEILRDAGFTTGGALAAELRSRQATRGGVTIEELPRSDFIAAVSELFHESGWGRMEIDASRPALTVLDVHEWSESSSSRGGTHFTTGMLAGFFGTVAGAELAVLEVDPPSPGHGQGRFLMGSVATVDDLFVRLDAGDAVADVLEGLKTA